jgi:hypothetical protein
MYRHVHIRNPKAARMLSERIFHLSITRNTDVWRWVWTFYEQWHETFGEWHTSSEATMPLLARAVNLIEIDLRTPVSSELLVTLRQCCPSLRSLKIRVYPELHGAMAQVGLFEHVKHLNIMTIRTRSHWNLPMDPLTDVPSWNMPAVTRFCWEDHYTKFALEASFMSRWRFPRLTHLDIEFNYPYTDSEGTPHICHFLDVHRSIRSFRIHARKEWYLSILPFVRARDLQIFCVYSCPPRALVSLLRPEVRTLGLEFDSFVWKHVVNDLTVSLWELLMQFAAEDDRLPTLETIRLSTSDIEGEHQPISDEGFLCTLRSHALTLNARGIRIFVDDDQICS